MQSTDYLQSLVLKIQGHHTQTKLQTYSKPNSFFKKAKVFWNKFGSVPEI